MKFEELNLKPELYKAVQRMGFTEATEIQAKCIPAVLSGKDMVGQSQTGSGKTAAFGLPILNGIEQGKGVQAIILTPTRELCVQVHDIMRQLSQFMKVRIASVYGGVGIGPQIDELKRAEIVVGTPGRVMDHLDRHTLDLSKTRYFILDEADRMLEMGFIDDVRTIMKYTPKEKQSLLFSATMPPPIKTIVQHNFKNPLFIVGQKLVDKSLLKQTYYNLYPHQKFSLLVHLLNQKQGIALVFCSTRIEVDAVTENLQKQNIKAVAIHGGLTQNKRLHVVELLRKEHVRVLVATDVAARGLDIRNINIVFNYDVPKTADEYIHRIGRTARAGDEGEAVTFLTQNDYNNFSRVLSDRSLNIQKAQIPVCPVIPFERERRRFSSRFSQDRAQRPQSTFGQRYSTSGRTGVHDFRKERDSRDERRERRERREKR